MKKADKTIGSIHKVGDEKWNKGVSRLDDVLKLVQEGFKTAEGGLTVWKAWKSLKTGMGALSKIGSLDKLKVPLMFTKIMKGVWA